MLATGWSSWPRTIGAAAESTVAPITTMCWVTVQELGYRGLRLLARLGIVLGPRDERDYRAEGLTAYPT